MSARHQAGKTMTHLKQNRRSLLLGAAGLALGGTALSQAAAPDAKAYVLQSSEGETVVRPSGDIVIKVDPIRGAPNIAMGTQHLKIGAGIPVHRHELMDEILLVQDGRGAAIVNDARVPIEKGSTIYVPKGQWHGFDNPDSTLDLVWIVTPPGLEAFFREIGNPPGSPPKTLTREQFREIGQKHGTIFKG
jgi:quercetin dioxygenase-like cupin family protein